MNAQSQQDQDNEIRIIYNRVTGEVRIEGGVLQPDSQDYASLPIQTEGAVRFEPILIWHPGCVWYKGKQYC